MLLDARANPCSANAMGLSVLAYASPKTVGLFKQNRETLFKKVFEHK